MYWSDATVLDDYAMTTTTMVNLLICASYYTVTPVHELYGRLINFSSTCRDFLLNLVKDRLVIWLLRSGMDTS